MLRLLPIRLLPIRLLPILGLLILPFSVTSFCGCQNKAEKEKENSSGTNKKTITKQEKSAPSVFVFENRAPTSGITGTYSNGGEANLRTMLETLGGGIGAIDFDLDGVTDCFFNGGGTISKDKKIGGIRSYFYRNLQNWNFEDCTEISGVDTTSLYNHGCQCGDIDNDGFADLVVSGFQGILVFRNLGDGTFEPIECGINTDLWATSMALSDFDGDGNLDLFVCNYLDWSFKNHEPCKARNGNFDVCSPRKFDGVVDDLFTSQGDWTFVRDGKKKGIKSVGKSLGVVTGDIDLDGDIDIYVACDVTANLLYLNRGNGSFDEVGTVMGVDLGEGSMPNGSMGTGLVDFNKDGLPDIGVANFENENFALYKQVRVGKAGADTILFSLASKKSQLNAIDQLYVSWGTLFEDLDSDGDDDLVINNGHIQYFPQSGVIEQQPQIFTNSNGVFRFKNVAKSEYFDKRHFGRGLIAADFDQDGDLDLAFSNCNEPFAVLENKSEAKKKNCRVQIIGTQMNRDGINALVGRDQGEFVKLRSGGGSYLSSGDNACWLVLGQESELSVKNVTDPAISRFDHHVVAVESPASK